MNLQEITPPQDFDAMESLEEGTYFYSNAQNERGRWSAYIKLYHGCQYVAEFISQEDAAFFTDHKNKLG